MFTIEKAEQEFGFIWGLLALGKVEEAKVVARCAEVAAREERQQYEEWIERQAGAEEAWAAGGSELARELCSSVEQLEEVPW